MASIEYQQSITNRNGKGLEASDLKVAEIDFLTCSWCDPVRPGTEPGQIRRDFLYLEIGA